MFAILWRYHVRQDHRADFEAAYRASGDWARLFGRHQGFRGTQLLRGEAGAYLTLDVWRAREDFHDFLVEHGKDYSALDERTDGWTSVEERLGEFETVD